MEIRRAVALIMLVTGFAVLPFAAVGALDPFDSDRWDHNWDRGWSDDRDWQIRWDAGADLEHLEAPAGPAGPVSPPAPPGADQSGPLDQPAGGYSGPLDD